MTARLASLLDEIEGASVRGSQDTVVTDVTQDSAAVQPGSLYCCIPGRRVDGHDFAPAAIAAGAHALLVERALPVNVAQVVVPSTRRAVGPVAAAFFGHPSRELRVAGVTGTNGKTTVVQLLAAVFAAAGWRARALGTLEGIRTTPEAPVLQRTLADWRSDGVAAAAIEVSSMALDQHRVAGIEFSVTVWTNLSQDHLDYHVTMEAYFAAKARLFSTRCPSVVNVDDRWGRRLRDELVAAGAVVIPYSLGDASDATIGVRDSRFRWRGVEVDVHLGGRHNVANALAAATAALTLGLEPEVIAAGIGSVRGVCGRWEPVGGSQPFTVLVDYAHTPDGLAQVLEAATAAVGPNGRVVVVFGCGGDRDRGKRPLMAEVATRIAAVAVLTSDNPRTEDPDAIIAEAAAGAGHPERLVIEPDRRSAIETAIRLAQPGDLVVIAGKGHETGQVIGETVVPFDDRAEAQRALAALGFGASR